MPTKLVEPTHILDPNFIEKKIFFSDSFSNFKTEQQKSLHEI